MKTAKKRPVSLKAGVLTTILLCWLIPILIVVTLFGVLLGYSYKNSTQQEIEISAKNALYQVQLLTDSVVDDSNAVSYDGLILGAYRKYTEEKDEANLYRSVSGYIKMAFSRESKYKGVFVNFLDPDIQQQPYVLCSGTATHSAFIKYQKNAPVILKKVQKAGTGVHFMIHDGELYAVRNLYDTRLEQYAVITLMLDPEAVFRPLSSLTLIDNIQIRLDDCHFAMNNGVVTELKGSIEDTQNNIEFSTKVRDHDFAFTAETMKFNPWKDTPWLFLSVVGAALLVLPLLAAIVYLFYRHITRPMEVLSEANDKVQNGQRGYQIEAEPANIEFAGLYQHFNAMSLELKNQFEKALLEQQTTQRAQIKALQSQINPHFLNNTLEIINWEARFANNERVCAMIEALSTMLDAALDRDGRTQVPFYQEMGYVDAYLYIIKERLGDGFHITKDIDESILSCQVPRLILQPIVENAVEHDMTPRKGGNLCVRAYRDDRMITLEVEHDGTLTDEDRENVKKILADQNINGKSVGIRNVNQRLRLIYGEKGKLTIEQSKPGVVIAKVTFPFA